mmetsp:Transcript_37789/g.112265  ORF Transcript_37789/g.112265 Transcript_37789/m.112265 type:complete len:396 (+) Transcript_37789:498-1685(+)
MGVVLQRVAPRVAEHGGLLPGDAAVERDGGRLEPDDDHEFVGGRRPRDVLHLAILGAVDLRRHLRIGLEPVEVGRAEVGRAALVDVAVGQDQERRAVEVPADHGVLHLRREVDLDGGLAQVVQVVDRHARHLPSLLLGDEDGRVEVALLRRRGHHEHRGVLLRDDTDPHVILDLLQAALARHDARARRELEAHLLVGGPRDQLHREGSAGIALQGAGVEPLAKVLAGEAPDVHVHGVKRVPLLVVHDEGLLRREAAIAHTARASANIRSHLLHRGVQLVLLVSIVDAEPVVAHGCQVLPVGAPRMAEGIIRRAQLRHHLDLGAGALRVDAAPVFPAALLCSSAQGVHVIDDNTFLSRREEFHRHGLKREPGGHKQSCKNFCRCPERCATWNAHSL